MTPFGPGPVRALAPNGLAAKRQRDMNEFPRRFGPYVLLKPLARGGMGALYLALSGPRTRRSSASSRRCCRTSPTRNTCSVSATRPRSSCACRTATWCPVFDSGQVAGEIYLAMDFVEGKDLRATWNRCAKKGIAFPVDVAAHLAQGARARAGLRAQLRRHQAGPPRRLAAQRAAVVQRRGAADRLRAGVVDAEDGEDRARDHLRQGQLHVARAGARREARRPHRSLRVGDHPVGAAHGPAAVPVGQAAGRRQGRPHVRGAPAPRAQSRGRARRRSARRACRPSWIASR